MKFPSVISSIPHPTIGVSDTLTTVMGILASKVVYLSHNVIKEEKLLLGVVAAAAINVE